MTSVRELASEDLSCPVTSSSIPDKCWTIQSYDIKSKHGITRQKQQIHVIYEVFCVKKSWYRVFQKIKISKIHASDQSGIQVCRRPSGIKDCRRIPILKDLEKLVFWLPRNFCFFQNFFIYLFNVVLSFEHVFSEIWAASSDPVHYLKNPSNNKLL